MRLLLKEAKEQGSSGEGYFPGSEPYYWQIPFLLAQAVLLGRRGWIIYKDDELSPVQKFQVRGDSLSYVTAWLLLCCTAVVFGFLSPEPHEGVNVAGVFFVEFVAVATWSHFFGNGRLVAELVNETFERLQSLLVLGLGLTQAEHDTIRGHIERRVVACATNLLKVEPWHRLTEEARQKLFYVISIECGSVIDHHLWEGGLSGGSMAYFEEWRRDNDMRGQGLRVHKFIQRELNPSADERHQCEDARKLCVAIMMATEDAELRRTRQGVLRPGTQFTGIRTVRRKVVSEGILRWPDYKGQARHARLVDLDANVDELQCVNGHETAPVCRLSDLPFSVLYTIREILQAGYVKVSGETTTVHIKFVHGLMVFQKEEWDTQRVLKRRPFRFITSATWLAGNVAFRVEHREEVHSIQQLDKRDSGSLAGTLILEVKLEVEEEDDWLQKLSDREESSCMWGETSLSEYHHPTGLNYLIMLLVHGFWKLIGAAKQLWEVASELLIKIYIWPVKLQVDSVEDHKAMGRQEKLQVLVKHKSSREAWVNVLEEENASPNPQNCGPSLPVPVSESLRNWMKEEISPYGVPDSAWFIQRG